MRLILAIILLMTSLLAQAQMEFAPIGAEWFYTDTYRGSAENYYNRIISENDTIIQEYNCRILKKYYDNSETEIEKYIIKEHQGKVYYYYQDQFHLLLDYNVNVNDTAEFAFMYKHYYNFPLSYTDSSISAKFHIDSISINEQNLKMFHATVIDEDAANFMNLYFSAPSTYTYIEGIGLFNEFMPKLDNGAKPDMEVSRWLRCYTDINMHYVSDKWAAYSLPCNHTILNSIKNLFGERSQVYPNPFNDFIYVLSKHEGHIEIFNSRGNVIYSSEVTAGLNKIRSLHFLSGIYYIRMNSKEDHSQTFKIIKK